MTSLSPTSAPEPGQVAGAAALNLPLVHPTYLRQLVAAATSEGVDLDACLTPLGMDAITLARHEAPVSLAVWRGLMLGLERVAPRPGLAIRLGRRVPLIAHGPLAYLMASSSDLRQALAGVVRFAPLRLAVLDVQLREREKRLELRLRPRVSLGDVERFTLDFLLAMLCTMLDDLRVGACQGMTLRLPGAGANAVRCWTEQGVHVERSVSGAYLSFPSVLAATTLPTASPRDHIRAWEACENAEREAGWSASISSRIEQLFRTGQETNYQLAVVAEHLGVSRRTLMRRLNEEGTSFSSLVDANRKERLLRRMSERQSARRERRLTLGEIATDLGYADSAVLGRAVQRWFGMSTRELQRGLDEGMVSRDGRRLAPSPKADFLAPDVLGHHRWSQ